MYVQEVVCESCGNRNIINEYARVTFCRRCCHSLVDKTDVATVEDLKKYPESGHVHFVEFKKHYVSDEEIIRYIDNKKQRGREKR